MQVSTRANDYLVDTLLLRDAIGPALRPVFARPDVLKVLHGCVCDIEWLQKDFGVWVVCAFDTQQAAKLLDLADRLWTFTAPVHWHQGAAPRSARIRG